MGSARERARHVAETAATESRHRRELEQVREQGQQELEQVREQARQEREQEREQARQDREQSDARVNARIDALEARFRQGQQVQNPAAQNDHNAVGGGQPLAMDPMDVERDLINLTLEDSPPPSPPAPPPPPPPPPHQTIQEQLDEWNRQADLQIAHGSYYADWRTSLSQVDIRCGFEILKQDEPQNPTIVYAPERAGKSGAIFDLVKAAQVAGKSVIILCAPTKVAPVMDMVNKLYKAGFDNLDTGCKIAHTLGAKTGECWDSQVFTQDETVIYVGALTSYADLDKVAMFAKDQKLSNRGVVCIVDECDEIVMGRGSSSMFVNPRFNANNYTEYLTAGAGEDAGDGENVDEGAGDEEDEEDEEGNRMAVAKARKCFKEEVVPHVKLFMVTATVSGILVDPLGVFRMDLPTRVLLVNISPNYIGISNFTIPEGCNDFREGMAGVRDHYSSIFQENNGNLEILKKFVAHENPHDGEYLTHAVDPNKRVQLKGLIYITTTNRVDAAGGITCFANELSNYMETNCPQFYSSTLIVSFVGVPHCKLNGVSFKFAKGTNLQQMYDKMAERYNDPDEHTVQIHGSDPEHVCFTDAITHIYLLGYTLTRRAMTAAFNPADKPGTLVMPMYVIARSGKASKVDADSQRIMRAGGDTGEYNLPPGYQVWISCNPELLKNLNSLRRVENDSLIKQAQAYRVHADFLHLYSADEHGIADLKVTKGGLSLSGIGHGTGGYAAAQVVRGAVEKFQEYLTAYAGLRRSGRGDGSLAHKTVLRYTAIVIQMMRSWQTGGQGRLIRLSEIVSFATLEAFIQSELWSYGEWYDGTINVADMPGRAGRAGNIASAFKHLKEFSETEDGASAITDAEQA
jgi:hypothetical protein